MTTSTNKAPQQRNLTVQFITKLAYIKIDGLKEQAKVFQGLELWDEMNQCLGQIERLTELVTWWTKEHSNASESTYNEQLERLCISDPRWDGANNLLNGLVYFYVQATV